MKRFIAIIVFPVAVIMCEQQTLFAPHYTDFSSKVAAVEVNSEGRPTDFYEKNQLKQWFSSDGLIAIIAVAASEAGLIDPADCPSLGGQEGEDIVDSAGRSNFHGCILMDGPDVMHTDLAMDLLL